MMARIYLGIDIQYNGLTFAALKRDRPNNFLQGLRFESLEGVFEFSSRQPNIRDARRFIDGLRRGAETLSSAEERVSLSLPDRVGMIFVTEVDAPFKTRKEAIDILKWRLKASLPLPPAQMQLDYQVLDRREEGRQRCLVAAIALPVLDQYQELVNEAGRHAVKIDFHSFNLYNYYRPRLNLGDEFILVSLELGFLNIQYFSGKVFSYQRSREVKNSPDKIFWEINRTLVELYESHPNSRRCGVFVHVDSGHDKTMVDMLPDLLPSLFEREIHLLDPNLKRFSGAGRTGGLLPSGTVIAALGAAERLMRG